ncbi:MAG TPA: sigma-E factor negative regulatory protein [Burkholderiales bacterium]|nr:sigma-E factor negative regulatory protein [Burkholderiales bacterium]
MKSRISELMDGELERHEAAAPLDALRGEGELRDAWRSYHLIGDAMRDSRMLSAGFAGRVAAKLAEEPTVVAPVRLPPAPDRARWALLSVAASVAAVAMVSSVWFMLQEGAGPGPQVALAPQPVLASKGTDAQAVPAAAPVAQVPPPASANDYLYAHQGYSPRNTLQGVAPYVRMVSGEARPEK